MAVDYDLVIIGSSHAGLYAAKNAAILQARVALVIQCDGLFLPNDTLFIHSMGEIADLNTRWTAHPGTRELNRGRISLPDGIDWANSTVAAMQEGNNSLASLAALGVDVIVGQGEFCRLPKLTFNVARRKLRSRNYLLATGTNFVPQFLSDAAVSYLTPTELSQRDLTDLGSQIVIIGHDPLALELAQTLARFDKEVTLIIEQTRILPQEDLDLALLLQAQLEAEGIIVYSNVPVSQVKVLDRQKWLQVGDRAITADEIIIADYRQPNITGLNLAGVNVKYDEQKILVNRKLQTTNPQIYACGDLIGGYSLPNIAQHEVNLILKNTLFLPWYKVNYYALPWAVLTRPNLARVGFTERQAKEKYGDDVRAIAYHLKDTAWGQIADRPTGMCKLLVRSNGEIVGCSIIGDRAAELITAIALMMKHQIGLDRNPMRGLTSLSIPSVYPTMAEILERASQDFYQQKLQNNSKLLSRLRNWFSLYKDWHR